MKPAILFILVVLTLASCQKVINVDLNSSSPQYVIEGNVTDKPGAQKILISRSVNFSDPNSFPEVSGAFVTIKDVTANVLDTLSETAKGTYETHKITGTPGNTYEMYIKVDGREFRAASTMPQPVSIDSILLAKSVFGNDTFPTPYYQDPISVIGNYYRLTLKINKTAVKEFDIRDDEVTNGQVSKFPFFYDTDDNKNPKIKSGDSVFMSLQTIDQHVFEFYRTLQETIQQNSATQVNPLTNITGGALGYFSANAVRTTGILVR